MELTPEQLFWESIAHQTLFPRGVTLALAGVAGAALLVLLVAAPRLHIRSERLRVACGAR
ncbi:MAG: hypothetical protein HC876_11490 [Chloroflexaceae bacterium]|nr:hypothetical protein [Chloroflexaceae bacterium]